ncbi:MAG: TonB-dependent receptor [Acidobacteriia bacterium]|nr:TonB-dependent receptor [Terriglobia bacterium]
MRIISWVGARNAIQLLGVCLGVLLLCLSAFSQANTGRISGSVTDESGGAIQGATVSVRDVDRGTTRILTTDDAGAYNAPNLVPGTYTVKAEYQGFKTVQRENIVLEVGKDIRVDLSLQPGAQTQTITVSEAIPLVETTNATLGGTLSNATIEDMPLNGRNFMNLLQLRPGVTIYPGGGAWTQSTNGLRPEHNVYILDGITAIEPFSAQSVVNGVGLSGDAATLLPVDSIQEFNTQQNPKAEYGWKPGAIANIGLKSGTNTFHGSAAAFGRTDALDARNPFDSGLDGDGNPIPKQHIGLEQFGASVGGPIKKDKLFFFMGYEGQRYAIGNPARITFPTTTSIGDSAHSVVDACLAVPAGSRSSTSLLVAGLDATTCARTTGPTIFQSGPSANYAVAFNTDLQVDNGLAKIDYHINQKNMLHATYFAGQNTGFPVNSSAITQPYWRPAQYTRAQMVGGTWNYIPSSAIVNEARVGFSRYTQSFKPADCPGSGAGQPEFDLNTGAGSCGFPNLTLRGFSGAIGCCANFPKFQGPDMTWEFVENLSYLHGAHSFKFGGELHKNIYNGGTFNTGKGRITFTSLQNFMTGTALNGQLFSGDPMRTLRTWGFAGFAQDDWRITHRLVFNLGLRYEYVTPIKDANNLIGNFDPTLGMVQVGKQINTPYNGDHNNFAPRVGFAWDIRGNGKTVLRGGGGIIYVLEGFNIFVSQQFTVATTTGLNTIPTGALINGVAGPGTITAGGLALTTAQVNWNQNPAINGGSIFPTGLVSCTNAKPCPILSVDPNLRSPYVGNWSLSIQHAFTNNLSLEVGYVGNHATKLIGLTDRNAPPMGAGFTIPDDITSCLSSFGTSAKCSPSATLIQANRPFTKACPTPLPTGLGSAGCFPYLSNINLVSNVYLSNYHGMQVTLTQRPVHGFSYTLGFTWAHALDDITNDWGQNVPQNSLNPRAEYSNSGFDIRRRFTLTTTYALPGKKGYAQMLEGWKINAIVNIQGALPWGVLSNGRVNSSADVSGTGEFMDRWNFYGNSSDFSHLGATSVPFFLPGLPPVSDPTSPAYAKNNVDCTSKALALDGGTAGAATAALYKYGCFEQGTSVMIPPGLGTFGSMTRNTFRGNGLQLLDLSVNKDWKFTERIGGQFRFEVFNVLNHTQYANPQFNAPGGNDPFNNPDTFGTAGQTPDVSNNNPSIGAGASRSVQIGFRLTF